MNSIFPEVIRVLSMTFKNKEPTCVFIDSTYLYKIQKEFEKIYGEKYKLEYNQLAITLAKSQGLWLNSAFYYCAPPYQNPQPSEEQRRRMAGYTKVMNYYRKNPNFYVREGRCQLIDGTYAEKGVDTLMVMDLMKITTMKDIKTIILLVCDTDFVPIINELRSTYGIQIILFHYTDRKRNSMFSMSNHLQTVSNKCILLQKEHFTSSLLRPKNK